MKIGLIGGTGGMGIGYALRWAFRHDVIIGSREAQKATEAAKIYTKIAKEFYGNRMTGSITGDHNLRVTKSSDILLLSIHYEHIPEMCTQLSKQLRDDCIVSLLKKKQSEVERIPEGEQPFTGNDFLILEELRLEYDREMKTRNDSV